MKLIYLATVMVLWGLQPNMTDAQIPDNSSDVNTGFAMRHPSGAGCASGAADVANDLLVYPDPVVSSTKVVLSGPSAGIVYADVVSMNGVVDRSYQYVPGSNVLDVDMSKLPAGWYSLRVWGKDIGCHNSEVVKE